MHFISVGMKFWVQTWLLFGLLGAINTYAQPGLYPGKKITIPILTESTNPDSLTFDTGMIIELEYDGVVKTAQEFNNYLVKAGKSPNNQLLVVTNENRERRPSNTASVFSYLMTPIRSAVDKFNELFGEQDTAKNREIAEIGKLRFLFVTGGRTIQAFSSVFLFHRISDAPFMSITSFLTATAISGICLFYPKISGALFSRQAPKDKPESILRELGRHTVNMLNNFALNIATTALLSNAFTLHKSPDQILDAALVGTIISLPINFYFSGRNERDPNLEIQSAKMQKWLSLSLNVLFQFKLFGDTTIFSMDLPSIVDSIYLLTGTGFAVAHILENSTKGQEFLQFSKKFVREVFNRSLKILEKRNATKEEIATFKEQAQKAIATGEQLNFTNFSSCENLLLGF